VGLVIRTPHARAALAMLTILTVWCGITEARGFLGPQSEEGFRCLIRMAQEAKLSAATVNANVSVENDRARLELLDDQGNKKTLFLAAPPPAQNTMGYFEITAGPGAEQQQVEAVGRALQTCFRADPFESPAERQDPVAAFWSPYDAVASFEYTMGVIALLSVCALAGVIVLWGAAPPRDHRGGSPISGRR
jgi:hypothetical protein